MTCFDNIEFEKIKLTSKLYRELTESDEQHDNNNNNEKRNMQNDKNRVNDLKVLKEKLVEEVVDKKKSAAYIKWEKEFDGKTSVDLKGKNLTDEDVLAIGELLQTNNTLKTLNLNNNDITNVQSIGEGLKTINT